MKIIFYDAEKINDNKIADMRRQRMSGNLVFVCSKEPYYKTYMQYYRYANGFVTNDYCYGQIGCCEVVRDQPLSLEEMKYLYTIIHPYAYLIFHGIKDSFVYKEAIPAGEYRIVPYRQQTVYSVSLHLKQDVNPQTVIELLNDTYILDQRKSFCSLHQINISLHQVCLEICRQFHVTDMELK